ncbi:MAG TPA: hypothetical protein VIU41_03890 [Geobacteraceae bacterium]
MRNDQKLPGVIFLSSCTTLAYEVLLTRIFSISLWYHYAFMIISIAMLGFAASGALLALRPGLRDLTRIPCLTLLLAAGIILSYLLANRVPFDPARLAWEKAQLLHICLYYVTLAIPFFCTGLIIATAFTTTSRTAGLLYGADLIGAGLGSLGALFLLGTLAPERAVFIIAATAAVAPLCTGGRTIKFVSLLLIGTNLALLAWHPQFAALRVSPYKGLPTALQYPGARPIKTYYSPFAVIDTFASPAVRFAPGLSLRYLEPLPAQTGLAVDKGDISAITAAVPVEPLAFLDHLPAALPYAIGRPGRVLVLDPKGGLQVLMARRHGAGTIHRVETNPALMKVVRDDFRDVAGDLYGEQTWTGLGRSWLAKGHERYDLIDLSLQGTETAGAFGIAEDYRFTTEAFREYLGHLAEDGFLSLNLFIIPPPRTELRLFATVVTALEELGIRDVARHVAIIRSWGSITMLIKKSPLTAGEIGGVRRFAGERWFDLVHLPGIRKEETNRHIRMATDDYSTAFRSILNRQERRAFIAGYIFDIAPMDDDRPFFHYHLRFGTIGAIYQAMGRKWAFFLEEGYLLPMVLLQALAISLVLLVLPAFARAPSPTGRTGTGQRLLPYFAFLGAGYMFVEIALVQKLILPLENPSHAVATVLAALLVSSGIGSLLSYRFTFLRNPAVCLAIAILIAIYSVLLPTLAATLAPCPLPLKMALVPMIFIPLGGLMGMPFPNGLQLLGEKSPHLIPWAWVINGSVSVLAPLAAVMIAMELGFSRVLLLGALAYFLAFLSLKAGTRREAQGSR